MSHHDDNSVTFLQWGIAAAVGLALSLGVWWPLAEGGGLVGGDVYPYFLPQKVMLAESFAQREIPLWHNLTGLGYPLLAESQAGVFYPPNQILYRFLDVNTAYNANILLHYWLAFVFTWRFGRCQGIGTWPAMLTALVFVYGWFPARISLEWSIFAGVFFPLTLWLTHRLVQQPGRLRFALLTGSIAIYLLAGHFTLAFISQLTAIAYAALCVVLRGDSQVPARQRWVAPTIVAAAVMTSLFLAAVQLIPTYELKQLSQRIGTANGAGSGAGEDFDPAFGHMPPLYATQVAASWWYWHSADAVASGKIKNIIGAIDANTNGVEAHLYWGLLPLTLMILLLNRSIRTQVNFSNCRIWLLLTLAAAIYATGWLIPVTRYLPGFGFFNGPGRYTIVCAMGGAVIAGAVLDGLLKKASAFQAALATTVLAALTLPDMLWSAEHVAHARVVARSPLASRDDSWIRRNLMNRGPLSCRLLAPGPNVGNLFGVSCIPEYLGIGPAAYYSKDLWPTTGPEQSDDEFPAADQLSKLKLLGITHILTTEPLIRPSAAIELVTKFPDALLNSMWGRGGELCYLYEVRSQPRRIVSEPHDALVAYRVTQVTANSVEFAADLATDAVVELRELMYPGWQATIDQVAVTPIDNGGMMRTVLVPAGQHIVRWTFRPASFAVGFWVSVFSVLSLCIMTAWPRRRDHLFEDRLGTRSSHEQSGDNT